MSEKMRVSILLVDPHVRKSNPSMKGWVEASAGLGSQGVEVSALCWEADADAQISVTKLPIRKVPGILKPWVFSLQANLFLVLQRMRGRKRPGLIVSTGFYVPYADICFVHFSHFNWIGGQIRAGITSARDFCAALVAVIGGAIAELILFWWPVKNRLIAVSDAVAGDVRRFGAPWKNVGVLPNCYDPTRFCLDVREAHRERTRASFGYRDDAKVFMFLSQGHHRRKGFWLAVDAVARLRSCPSGGGDCFLLVIGGAEKTIRRLKLRLDKRYSDWRDWIEFTGMVQEVERYVASADAFLFPSYSEAFCLAEIEASAMGIRLYLTPHHGTEMILEPGVNGEFIDWCPEAIASTLRREIEQGRASRGDPYTGRALTVDEYSEALGRLVLEENEKGSARAFPVATPGRGGGSNR